MGYTSRFDGKGGIYAKARPKYAAARFEYFKNTLHIPAGSVFADVGSGTWIFTEQLLHCGYRVFAVEPNADIKECSGFAIERDGFCGKFCCAFAAGFVDIFAETVIRHKKCLKLSFSCFFHSNLVQ